MFSSHKMLSSIVFVEHLNIKFSNAVLDLRVYIILKTHAHVIKEAQKSKSLISLTIAIPVDPSLIFYMVLLLIVWIVDQGITKGG
jgi:hypothetical protein